MSPTIKPPFESQQFTSHQEWVNKASSWLTCHPQYNNTEHGDEDGWRGHHFTAMCFDSKGRRCRNGGDFALAEAEDAFPVWWVWPDQIGSLVEMADKLRDVVSRCEEHVIESELPFKRELLADIVSATATHSNTGDAT